MLPSPFLGDFLFAELPGLALQHGHSLFVTEFHLLAYGDQASSDVVVVLAQKIDGEHHVVDVVEHERMLVGVLLLLRQECDWVITPMSQRIEVV